MKKFTGFPISKVFPRTPFQKPAAGQPAGPGPDGSDKDPAEMPTHAQTIGCFGARSAP